MSNLLHLGNAQNHRLLLDLQEKLVESGYFDRGSVIIERGENEWLTLRARRSLTRPTHLAPLSAQDVLFMTSGRDPDAPFAPAETIGIGKDGGLVLDYLYWRSLNGMINVEVLPTPAGQPKPFPARPVTGRRKAPAPSATKVACLDFEYVIFDDETSLWIDVKDTLEVCQGAERAFAALTRP